jgi:hypothetical protein
MSLRDTLHNWRTGKRELAPVAPPPPEAPVPPVDLSVLWEDPEEGSGLATILGVVNTVLLFLILILGFFGK